jgi:nicotinamidase-related amidase
MTSQFQPSSGKGAAETRRGHISGSTPYPWPYDGDLAPERLALVVAGWCDRWREACGPTDVAERIERLAAAVDLVVVIDHARDGSGAAPRAPVGPVVPVVVTTPGIDGFHASPRDDVLRRAGADHLVLAGFGLEGPVHSTMRSANDRGHECVLAIDACGVVDAALVPRAVSMIEMSGGIFGAVATTDQILAALAAPDQGDPSP